MHLSPDNFTTRSNHFAIPKPPPGSPGNENCISRLSVMFGNGFHTETTRPTRRRERPGKSLKQGKERSRESEDRRERDRNREGSSLSNSADINPYRKLSLTFLNVKSCISCHMYCTVDSPWEQSKVAPITGSLCIIRMELHYFANLTNKSGPIKRSELLTEGYCSYCISKLIILTSDTIITLPPIK